jgi:hypothetical protein
LLQALTTLTGPLISVSSWLSQLLRNSCCSDVQSCRYVSVMSLITLFENGQWAVSTQHTLGTEPPLKAPSCAKPGSSPGAPGHPAKSRSSYGWLVWLSAGWPTGWNSEISPIVQPTLSVPTQPETLTHLLAASLSRTMPPSPRLVGHACQGRGKGAVSMVLLTTWIIWKHHSACIFKDARHVLRSFLGRLGETRLWAHAGALGLRAGLPTACDVH